MIGGPRALSPLQGDRIVFALPSQGDAGDALGWLMAALQADDRPPVCTAAVFGRRHCRSATGRTNRNAALRGCEKIEPGGQCVRKAILRFSCRMNSIIPAPRSGLKGRNNSAQGIALGIRPQNCPVALKGQNKIADFGGGGPSFVGHAVHDGMRNRTVRAKRRSRHAQHDLRHSRVTLPNAGRSDCISARFRRIDANPS